MFHFQGEPVLQGVSEVKEGPDYSIVGIMGTSKQNHPVLGLEQEGGG